MLRTHIHFLFITGIVIISACSNSYSQTNLPEENTGQDSLAEKKIYEVVESEATYPGGAKAWLAFLEKHLDAAVPANRKAPAGTYTVLIQFVVDKQGTITEPKALTHHGYGMEEEVIRLLRISPKWIPAIQNGRPVRAYRKQPVTFQVEEEKKRRKRDRS
jgi:Gram-negative bacterial TonB protein C-terminal